MARDTKAQRVAMVVHHVCAPPLPQSDLKRDRWWQVAAPGDREQSWHVDTGPTTWATWTDGDAFGQPEPELPAVRFEAEPDSDTVDVIAPVLDGEWLLRVAMRRDGDELVPTGLELQPLPGARISARTLRTLGFGGIQRAAQDVLLGNTRLAGKTLGEQWARPVKQPGKAGRDDDFYADWAQRYVEGLAVAPRRPIAHLIEQAAEHGEHVTRGEIAARLTTARQRELLTDAPGRGTGGKAGGELTDKARRVLGIDEEGTDK